MNENEILELLRTDDEQRRLIARHFVRAEQAKHLMREAGYGWTGLDVLGTAKLLLEERRRTVQHLADIIDSFHNADRQPRGGYTIPAEPAFQWAVGFEWPWELGGFHYWFSHRWEARAPLSANNAREVWHRGRRLFGVRVDLWRITP